MIKCLALIPARGGSKGIPRKNVRLVGGMPLLVYTINHAKESKRVNRIVVSTDDKNIAGIAKKCNVAVIMRPKELGLDKTPMYDVVRHALTFLNENEGYRPDLEVLLQATNPFRKPGMIDEAIKVMESHKEADSLIGLGEFTPKFGHLVNGYYKPLYKEGLRRQDMKCYYRENGTIFIARYDTVMKQKSLWGKRVLGYVTDELSGIDIDVPFDLKLAQIIAKGFNGKRKGI